MMRQLGGSFGIAVITTFLSRQNMDHRSHLVSQLDVNSADVQSRVTGLQHAFMAKGMPADQALKAGYTTLDHMVTKQAAVLSYMDAFLYLGIMFLICIPFVLLVRGNRKSKVNIADAMH
jgi:MFS transporter, DHA2 family, multidrug resistance protein